MLRNQNIATTIIGALLLVLIGVFLATDRTRDLTETAINSELDRLLPSLTDHKNAEDITRIVIRTAMDEIQLVRGVNLRPDDVTGSMWGEWHVEDAYNGHLVDGEAVQRLLDNLRDIRRGQMVSKIPERHPEYQVTETSGTVVELYYTVPEIQEDQNLENNRVRADLVEHPFVSLIVGKAPETGPGEEDNENATDTENLGRYVRVGHPRSQPEEENDEQPRPETGWQYGPEVFRVEQVKGDRLSTKVLDWLEHRIFQIGGPAFESDEIIKLELSGQGLAINENEPFSVQRFESYEDLLEEPLPNAWWYADFNTSEAFPSPSDEPADRAKINDYLRAVLGARMADLDGQNPTREVPDDPYLRITLFSNEGIREIMAVEHLQRQQIVWGVMVQFQRTTLQMHELYNRYNSRMAEQGVRPDPPNVFLEAILPLIEDGRLEPQYASSGIFPMPEEDSANAASGNDPDGGTESEPEEGESEELPSTPQRYLHAVSLGPDTSPMEELERSQIQMQELIDERSELLAPIEEEMQQLQMQMMRVRPGGPQEDPEVFARIQEELTHLWRERRYVLFQTVEAFITREEVTDAPPTQTQPTYEYFLVTNASQPPYGWRYLISQAVVDRLMKAHDDFVPDPPQTMPGDEDAESPFDDDVEIPTEYPPQTQPEEQGSAPVPPPEDWERPEPGIVSAPANPRVVLETNYGTVELELYEDEAPNTVANFVELTQDGYYDDLRFHRVIAGFMIQGGCPNTRGGIVTDDLRRAPGTGGPGYRFADEFDNQVTGPQRSFDGPGILAMANAGANTNGSQFFITVGPAPQLNDPLRHTIFGRVVEGMDVVYRIAMQPTYRVGQSENLPVTEVIIYHAWVKQQRDHEYSVVTLGE